VSTRRSTLAIVGTMAIGIALSAWSVVEEDAPKVVVYKGASCACCLGWVSVLEEEGLTVEVHDVADVGAVATDHGIPDELRSCHVALVDAYILSGHVPTSAIKRILEERPEIMGLAVAGMPSGAPGMPRTGAEPEPYDVLAFDRTGRSWVHSTHEPR